MAYATVSHTYGNIGGAAQSRVVREMRAVGR